MLVLIFNNVAAQMINHTFYVSMQNYPNNFSTVHLSGSYFGWTADIVMSDNDGDGIYSVTLQLPIGDFDYKYMLDYWAEQEDLIDDMVNGSTCAPMTDYWSYANRVKLLEQTNKQLMYMLM